MPLVRITDVGKDARLGLWRMEEDSTAFEVWSDEAARLYKSAGRQLEYVCVRALLREMLGDDIPTITHNPDGKPLLSNGLAISISHTRGYCAVALSALHEVAIDIEYVSDRVGRIAHMFLRSDEVATENASLLLHWCAKETIYKLFSFDHLRYEEIRVCPFEDREKGSFMVENLKRSLTVDVNYEVTPDFVLTYAVM